MFSRHRSKGTHSLSPRRKTSFLRSSSSNKASSSPAHTTKTVEGVVGSTDVVVPEFQSQPPPQQLQLQQNRGRLDTEDTLRMSNIHDTTARTAMMHLSLPCLNSNDDDDDEVDNPFLDCQHQGSSLVSSSPRPIVVEERQHAAAVVVDCGTTVSSLRSGSFKMPAQPVVVQVVAPQQQPLQQQQRRRRRAPPTPEQPRQQAPPQAPPQKQQQQHLPPVPMVIYFRVETEVLETEVPDWLQEDDDDKSININPTYSGSLVQQQYSLELDRTVVTAADDDTLENHPLSSRVAPSTSRREPLPAPTTAGENPLPPFRPRHSFPSARASSKNSRLVQPPTVPPPVPSTTKTNAPSPAATNAPSTQILRPTLGRFKSASHIFPTKSRSLKQQQQQVPAITATAAKPLAVTAASRSSSSPFHTAAAANNNNNNKTNNTRHRRRVSYTPQATPTVVLPASWAAEPVVIMHNNNNTRPLSNSKLLPPSKSQQHHRRILSNDWTASTMACSSSHASSGHLHQHPHHHPSITANTTMDTAASAASSSQQDARRTSAVVQELRSVWTGLVAPPVVDAQGITTTFGVSEWEFQQQQHHSAHGCWT